MTGRKQEAEWSGGKPVAIIGVFEEGSWKRLFAKTGFPVNYYLFRSPGAFPLLGGRLEKPLSDQSGHDSAAYYHRNQYCVLFLSY